MAILCACEVQNNDFELQATAQVSNASEYAVLAPCGYLDVFVAVWEGASCVVRTLDACQAQHVFKVSRNTSF